MVPREGRTSASLVFNLASAWSGLCRLHDFPLLRKFSEKASVSELDGVSHRSWLACNG